MGQQVQLPSGRNRSVEAVPNIQTGPGLVYYPVIPETTALWEFLEQLPRPREHVSLRQTG